MRLLSPRHVCQEWVALCLLVQVFLTCGLLWLFSRSPDYLMQAAHVKPNCVDKSVRYNLHLSEEKPTGEGGKRVIEQAIETHDVSYLNAEQPLVNKAATAADDEVLDETKGLLDRSRKFKTHMHQIVGSEWSQLSSTRKVCLGAQTSLDRLYSLGETVDEWQGPISISLFVSDVEYVAAKVYIDALKKCFSGVDKRVSFHFTHPVKRPAKYNAEMEGLLKGFLQEKMSASALDGCKFLIDKHTAADLIELAVKKTYTNSEGKQFTDWRTTLPYPQNLLRNLAKAGCQTEYTMIPDIDMIPNPRMDLMLEDFFTSQREPKQCQTGNSSCAYVVPVYEIAEDVSHLPTTKKELLALKKDGKARGFHSKLFSLNSKSSNLPKWETLPTPVEEESGTVSLSAAYNVTKDYKFRYEPVYVAKADTPPFDERFIGFGMTRNTQVYEMYVCGYEFHVLDNAFASHWGFQTIKTRPKWRAHQQEVNNRRFDDFAKEIAARYGRDPYNMLKKLKKLNYQNIRVTYGDRKQAPPIIV